MILRRITNVAGVILDQADQDVSVDAAASFHENHVGSEPEHTFASMAEIEELGNFVSGYPVSAAHYSRIRGDYRFNDWVYCCRQRPNGTLCNTKHKWGYVVELKDGKLSIIGNECANKRFGVKKFRRDRNVFLAERRKRQIAARADALLRDKENIGARCIAYRSELDNLAEQISAVRRRLGRATWKAVEDRIKTNRTLVEVEVHTTRVVRGAAGEKTETREKAMQRIGAIRGIRVLDPAPVNSLFQLLREVHLALQELEATKPERKKALESIISRISGLDDFERGLNDVRHNLSILNHDDPWLFCYLVNDKAERWEAAAIALERDGQAVSHQKAKRLLSERDDQLRLSLSAVRIQIGFG